MSLLFTSQLDSGRGPEGAATEAQNSVAATFGSL